MKSQSSTPHTSSAAWTEIAVALAVAAIVFGVALLYSRRLGDELLAALEVEQLEAIPVQGEA